MSDGIEPLDPQQTAIQEQQTAKEGYIHRGLVALDIFVNVLTGGKEDETISSRSARAAIRGNPFGIAMSKFLDLFQSDHGAKAIAGDEERAKSAESTEEDSGGIHP